MAGRYNCRVPSLPVGTLTLLFSDIEGSTALLKALGAAWGEALSAQRTIVRHAFAAHALAGQFETGGGRERMPPAEYLRCPFFLTSA